MDNIELEKQKAISEQLYQQLSELEAKHATHTVAASKAAKEISRVKGQLTSVKAHYKKMLSNPDLLSKEPSNSDGNKRIAGGILIGLFFLAIVLLFSSLKPKETTPPDVNLGAEMPLGAVFAAETIDTSSEQITEAPERSDSSVYNWQYAVDRWNECKNDVSFYQDWVNWYGEESAMRMCIITHSENGSRDPNKTHVNSDLSVDVGLFQINAYWHCGKIGMPNGNECVNALKDPDTNLMVARQIYEAQGWTPWYGRKAHLPDFYTDRLTIN